MLLKEKSQSAFKQLVETYQDQIYNTCLGILQNAEDAEEAAQDTFIEVFRSIDQFRGDAQISTWLYRVASNKSLEIIRKQKRQKRFAFLSSLSGTSDQELRSSANFVHPGIQLESKEHAQALFKAISQLAENQKVAFTLSKIEGLSYQQIAEVMNISNSSVESLLFRAKSNLKKLLKNYYEKNLK